MRHQDNRCRLVRATAQDMLCKSHLPRVVWSRHPKAGVWSSASDELTRYETLRCHADKRLCHPARPRQMWSSEIVLWSSDRKQTRTSVQAWLTWSHYLTVGGNCQRNNSPGRTFWGVFMRQIPFFGYRAGFEAGERYCYASGLPCFHSARAWFRSLSWSFLHSSKG